MKDKTCAGIKLIGTFVMWVLLTEIGSALVGGDSGALLYVTFHFIINPVLGLIVVLFAIRHALKQQNIWLIITTLIACCIPFTIVYFAISGSFWLTETLGIKIR